MVTIQGDKVTILGIDFRYGLYYKDGMKKIIANILGFLKNISQYIPSKLC